MKAKYYITETVTNVYSVFYDEEELEERKLTFKEYLKQYDNNVWIAQQSDIVIKEIMYDECVEIIDSDFEHAEILD